MDQERIKCDIESTRGYSICHKCGQRATQFFEHGETLPLRHLPICEREVTLYLVRTENSILAIGNEGLNAGKKGLQVQG